jgi:hypothetical protein
MKLFCFLKETIENENILFQLFLKQIITYFRDSAPGSITSPEGFLMSGGIKCIFEKQFFEIF